MLAVLGCCWAVAPSAPCWPWWGVAGLRPPLHHAGCGGVLLGRGPLCTMLAVVGCCWAAAPSAPCWLWWGVAGPRPPLHHAGRGGGCLWGDGGGVAGLTSAGLRPPSDMLARGCHVGLQCVYVAETMNLGPARVHNLAWAGEAWQGATPCRAGLGGVAGRGPPLQSCTLVMPECYTVCDHSWCHISHFGGCERWWSLMQEQQHNDRHRLKITCLILGPEKQNLCIVGDQVHMHTLEWSTIP